MDYKARFEVEADSDDLRRVQRELGDTAEAADDMGRKGSSSAAMLKEGFTVAAGAAAAIAAGVTAVGAAVIKFGGDVERTMGVINRMPGGLSQAQAAVGGMVGQLDLAIERNRLMQAGLQLSNTDFAAVAEVATDYAAAVGGGTETIGQLGEALISLSRESLQRFGVSVDTNKSRSEQLSQALTQLRQRSNEMETGADTAGGAIARLSVAMSDLYTFTQRASSVVADEMTPALSRLSERLTGTSMSFEDMQRVSERVMRNFVSIIGGGIETAIEAWEFYTDRLSDGAHNIQEIFSNMGTNIGRVFDAIRRGEFNPDNWGLNWDMDLRVSTESFNAMDRFRENVDSNIAAINRATREAADVQTRLLTPQMGGGGGGSQRHPLQDILNLLEDYNHETEYAIELNRVLQEEEDALAEARQRNRNEIVQATMALNNFFSQLDRRNAQAAERQEALTARYTESVASFRDMSFQNVETVVASFERANQAAAESGNATISSMELMGATVANISGQIGRDLLGNVAQGFAQAAQAAIKGEQDFGKAMAGVLEQVLWGLGTEALVKSIFYLAEGIAAASSIVRAAQAPGYFAAAATYGVVAGLALGGGAAVSAANAGGGASSSPTTSPGALGGFGSDTGGGSGGGGGDVVFVLNNQAYFNETDMNRAIRRGLRDS